MVAGWVAIILVSHIPCYSLLTYRLLLAHWASHVHYNISFLSSCSHFFALGLGPFSVCMHCLEVSWVLDLQVHLSLIIFLTITLLHSIVSHWLCSLSLLFYSIYCLFCFIFSPLWVVILLSSCMEDSHIISAIYPTNTDSKILSLRRSSRQREFLLL